MKDLIYLDSCASTQIDPRVKQDIIESMNNDWMNPSSIYGRGKEVKRKIEHAREQVKRFINARPEDTIIFTSCSTEANNLALQGFINANNNTEVIFDNMQHPSINNLKEYIDSQSLYNEFYCDRSSVKTDKYGKINLTSLELSLEYVLKDAYRSRTVRPILVPVIYTNNETGVINDIRMISNLVHKYHGYILVDAAQTAYHKRIDVQKSDIDMLTFTSEKIGMPRGVGVLYVKNGIKIEPIFYGGHQENGYRPGTENQYMIISLGKQCERISKELKTYESQEMKIKYELLNAIEESCGGIGNFAINCYEPGESEFDCVEYANNILSIRFDGIDNQQLLTLLDQYGVCCSAGSACSSGEPKASKTLTSIGLTEEEAKSTLRFSFDHNFNRENISRFSKILKKCLITLK